MGEIKRVTFTVFFLYSNSYKVCGFTFHSLTSTILEQELREYKSGTHTHSRVSQKAPKCISSSDIVHMAVSIPQGPPTKNS